MSVPITIVVDGETVTGSLAPRSGSVWEFTLQVSANGADWRVPANVVREDGPTRLTTPHDWQTETEWESPRTTGQDFAIVEGVEAIEAFRRSCR